MNRRSGIEALEKRVLLAANPADPIPIRMVDGFEIATIDWQGQQVEMFAGRWVLAMNGYSGYYPDQQRRASDVVRQNDATFEVKQFLGDGIFLVNAPQQMQPAEVQSRLSRLPGYRQVVPDFRYETNLTPNDTFFSNQWGLHNVGQFGGVSNTDIDAPEAWNIHTGNNTVVVGIADTGVDYNHPDLMNNIWTNPGEIPGNGIDDDGNGYVDDWRGYDFIFNTNNPMDDSDHGTHVAGIAAAQGNNGLGISGVGWNLKIMALKIGSGTSISSSASVAAMFYVNNLKARPVNSVNVRAVNHSYSGPGFDPNFNFILTHHNNNGIMNVAAAGNNGSNNDISPRYPANYQQPNILSVANHTNQNQLEFGSNFGATTVHLAAPGTSILSTVRTTSGSYAFFDGTSMAAPFVAGAVGFLFSAAPSSSLASIKNAIMQGVTLGSAYNGRTISGGRLNLNGALAFIAPPAQLAAPDLTSSSDTGVSSVDNITRDDTPTFQGFGNVGQIVRLYANGVLVGQTNPLVGTIYTVTANAMADGVYDFTVTTSNANGESVPSPALQVTIDTVAPVPVGLYAYQNSPHSYDIAWGENVTHAISDADFGVVNTGTSSAVAHGATHNGTTHVTKLLFPGNSILADGRYRLTIFASGAGGGITDVAGNPLAADVQLDFLFMVGDANNDGRVNLADFNILAANFGQSPRDFAQGDFNYDGIVNLTDFNILASRFGQIIAPEPTAAASPFGGTRIGTGGNGSGKSLGSDDDTLGDMLA